MKRLSVESCGTADEVSNALGGFTDSAGHFIDDFWTPAQRYRVTLVIEAIDDLPGKTGARCGE